MSKSYAEYSAARRAGLTGADAIAVDVFDRAYALGAALAEARQERGLKQRELAEISGVDQGDISRIERGVLAPTTPTLLRLAEGLNARITLELLPADPVDEPVTAAGLQSRRTYRKKPLVVLDPIMITVREPDVYGVLERLAAHGSTEIDAPQAPAMAPPSDGAPPVDGSSGKRLTRSKVPTPARSPTRTTHADTAAATPPRPSMTSVTTPAGSSTRTSAAARFPDRSACR